MAKKQKNIVKNSKQDNQKICSILSYLFIGLIWYAFEEKIRDDVTKYHVKQGLILFIAELIILFG